MGCSFLPSISAVVTTVVILPLILFGTTIIPCVVSTSIGMEDLTGNQIDIAQQNMSQYNQFQINDNDGGQHHYTDQWAVHVLGGSHKADQIAVKHGFVNTGEILPDFYHFVHERIAKRSIEPCHEYHQLLSAEPEVRWHEQQKVKRRSKRDFLQISPKLSSNGGGGGGERSGRSRTVKRSRVVAFNDPRWPAMWYLNRGPGLDMNVNEAWGEGITGKGIVVTILDDGLEKDHPDIVRNYDPMASFDVNSLDMDPMPTYDLTDSNRHGTRCAGEVAAEANNSICAVGVAYEASVGGVRMLDGDVTDAVEARSLSHNPQHIDIYSASWGPDDDGKTVDGPGELATRAFIEGVSKGRGGRGSIFVWASGNGGRDHDNCNCDGYTNSIWTLSISSATENGLVPWYSEACSSTLATTYSSGGTGEKQIVTIDLHHSCTSSHTGTSASAPLAAGICALALQANTNLTWRDMQHIVVRTARPQNLIAPDWATNGVGRNVSHSFGYGLMDAGAMVKLAKRWKTVAEQNKCEVRAPYTDKNIPAKSKVTLDLKVTNCDGVNFLEHVQAKVTLTSGRRGDLQIYLVSPSGTRSTLLAHRRHDLNRSGFTDWPFMTVHSWGENPIGKWTLEIHNEGRYAGKLQTWTLVAHGIAASPNESDIENGSTKVVSPGEVIAKVPGADGRGTNTDTNGNVAGAGQQPVVEFDGSENSIVIQPSQVHDPPLGVETGDAVAGVPLSTSSASSSSSSSSNCAKMSMNGQCLDCLPGLALLHGICLERCPDTFYSDSRGSQTQAAEVAVSTDNYGSVNPSYVCLPCHYSCKLCSGPNEFECLSCHSDASLHVEEEKSGSGSGGRNESHCYPVVLLDTLNSNEFWYKTLMVTVLVNVCFVAALLIYIWFQRRVSGGEGGSRKRKPHLRPHLQRQSYRRISPDEDHPTILNVNVGSGSEDEDEEESDEYSDRHREDNDNNHLENYPSHHQHSKLVVKNPYLNSLGGARGSGGDSSSNLNIENKNHFPSAAPVTEPQSRLPASSIYSKSDELFS